MDPRNSRSRANLIWLDGRIQVARPYHGFTVPRIRSYRYPTSRRGSSITRFSMLIAARKVLPEFRTVAALEGYLGMSGALNRAGGSKTAAQKARLACTRKPIGQSVSPASAIGVIGRVVSRQPTLQFQPRIFLAIERGLRRFWIIEGELENHVVRVNHVD